MKKCILTVAPAMTDATFEFLCEKARTKLGFEAEFVRKNDERVIAGFIMEYMGEVTDLSVGTQLARLKAHLEGQEG